MIYRAAKKWWQRISVYTYFIVYTSVALRNNNNFFKGEWGRAWLSIINWPQIQSRIVLIVVDKLILSVHICMYTRMESNCAYANLHVEGARGGDGGGGRGREGWVWLNIHFDFSSTYMANWHDLKFPFVNRTKFSMDRLDQNMTWFIVRTLLCLQSHRWRVTVQTLTFFAMI